MTHRARRSVPEALPSLASASVIRLPTACPEPPPRPARRGGRLPTGIISLPLYRRDRAMQKDMEYLREQAQAVARAQGFDDEVVRRLLKAAMDIMQKGETCA